MTPRRFVVILLSMVLLTIGVRIELGPRSANSQTEPFSAYLLALPQDTSTIQSTDFLFVQTAAGARKFPGTSIRSLIIDSLTVGFNAVSNGQLIVNSSVGATNTIQLCTSSGIQVLNPFTGQGVCLPTTTGTLGQVLTSSGSATVPMTWSNPGGGGGGGVTSFNGRTGAVAPATGDYSFSNIAGVATGAQLPNPTATALGGVQSALGGANQCMTGINTSGVPQIGSCVTSVGMTVPTGLAVAGSPVTGSGTLALSWSGTIPNSSIPTPTTTALGGVESALGGTGQFVTGINASGILQFSTPAGGGNVSTSGTIVPGQCPTWATTTTLNSVVCGGGGTNLGYVQVGAQGGFGDGNCHPLSGIYGSLAAAQAVYSFVSDLTQCADWAATQKAVNLAFAVGPTVNDASPIFCGLGNWQLSNPIFIDEANNTQGTSAAWAAGTTYANNATVKYNGIPWISMGAGNIGAPPTSSNNFPAQLQLDTNDTFPIKVVTITNASPAVFTLARGASAVVNNMPIVLMPQSYAVPGGATPVLPTGLNAQQVYYIKTIVGNTFQVAATPGGASINTTSAGVGVFFANSQVWQVNPVAGSQFGARLAFIGQDGLAGNSGCRYTATSMWMNAAFYIGPHNGVLVQSVSVNHANGGGSTPPYRCNRWHGLGQGQNSNYNFFANHVGWQQLTNGGGSSRTKYENVGATGFFTNFAIGYSNGQLGDSNTFFKSTFSDSCIGVEWMETQAFINTMYDSTVFFTTTALKSEASEGVRVIGGNFSGVQGISNSFAISAVSISGNVVTATVAAPDQYLQSAMCAMNAGYTLNAVGPDYLNSTPLGNSCGYNVFTIVTPHNGVIPFYVSSFNPNTNVITLNVAPAWLNIYLGSFGIPSEVTSATKMYAAEMSDVFFGQVQAENLHIENPLMATTLMCNCGGFGAARAGELKSVLLNSPLSRGPSVCCNQPGIPDSTLAHFYAQQTVPAITAWQGDIILDQLSSGSDFPFSPNLGDRALLANNTSQWIEGRHTQVGTLPNSSASTGAAPSFDFQADAQNNYTSIEGFTNTTLSGGYFQNNDQTFGGGTWDTPGFFLPASKGSLDIAVNNRVLQDIPSWWRVQGYGVHRNVGLRPDPQSQPCILPAQANTLAGALPAITHQSNLIFQSFLTVTAGGTGYAVNDTITLAGGTFSTAAVGQVTAVSGGAVTQFTINQVLGVYSVQPAATFTQSATSGGGTGATFSALGPIWYVNYTISYPMLWGGQLYRLCDYKGPTAASNGKFSIQSNNIGYSYYQNLTTTNVPNLSWTMSPQSPFVYMNVEALELMMPGLNITLTPDNTNGCGNVAESFQVLEVHPTLGYIKVVNSGSNTGPQLPQFPGAGPCKNTTIGQQAVNLVYPY